MTNLTTHIASAVEIKRQMNDQMTTLYGRLRDPAAFSKEKIDAGKVLERQYAPAIRRIVEATTHDDLVERRDRLNTRLNKGWAYCHLNPADEDAHAAWEAFLVEYTVIVDALNHVGIVAGVMERISRIESFVEGVAHASV
jgi:hypothetical protein